MGCSRTPDGCVAGGTCMVHASGRTGDGETASARQQWMRFVRERGRFMDRRVGRGGVVGRYACISLGA